MLETFVMRPVVCLQDPSIHPTRSTTTVTMRARIGATCILIVALHVSAVARQAQPERTPNGVRFLDIGSTLDELQRNTRATLSWRDKDGSELFVWIDGTEPGMAVTMDRAYFVSQGDRQFWGFVDPASGQARSFDDPVRQYMSLRHVRQSVRLVTIPLDGNTSFVRLLGRRDDGAAVYELGYASLSGERASQEEIRTYLLYRSADGIWQAATHDLGPDQWSVRQGWYQILLTRQMRVKWAAPGAVNAFSVELTETRRYAQANADPNPVRSYETHRDGALRGVVPMQMTMSVRQTLRAEDGDTLSSIARLLMRYHSSVGPSQDAQRIEDLWIRTLRRANPTLDPDRPITRGDRL